MEKYQKLFAQIFKFVIVGGLSFVIDTLIFMVLKDLLGVHYFIAGFISFTVSVIFNYLMSMRFVFKSKDDMSRSSEFIIFVALSVCGLGINQFLLWVFIGNYAMPSLPAKILIAGIVMVFNFVTRKIFLEKK